MLPFLVFAFVTGLVFFFLLKSHEIAPFIRKVLNFATAMEMQVPVVERPARPRGPGVAFGVCVCMVLIWTFNEATSRAHKGDVTLKNPVVEDTLERNKRLEKKFLLDWLETQRKGYEGSEFWSKEWWVKPVHLFNVKSWEIVDSQAGSFRVRIASTNKAGQPVENIWIVKVTGTWTTGRPKLSSVESAFKDTKD